MSDNDAEILSEIYSKVYRDKLLEMKEAIMTSEQLNPRYTEFKRLKEILNER